MKKVVSDIQYYTMIISICGIIFLSSSDNYSNKNGRSSRYMLVVDYLHLIIYTYIERSISKIYRYMYKNINILKMWVLRVQKNKNTTGLYLRVYMPRTARFQMFSLFWILYIECSFDYLLHIICVFR